MLEGSDARRSHAAAPSGTDGSRGVHPLRVLHIGNIANNAYLNARAMNAAGFDCDVICYDYFHIMGCPEWEDADFTGDVRDQFRPDWSRVDLHGFRRPRWFAQGPQRTCIRYLLARRRGRVGAAAFWWRMLALRRWAYANPSSRIVLAARALRDIGRGLRARGRGALAKARTSVARLRGAVRRAEAAARRIDGALAGGPAVLGVPGRFLLRAAGIAVMVAVEVVLLPARFCAQVWRNGRRLVALSGGDHGAVEGQFDERVDALIAAFRRCFPQRADMLQRDDLEPYRSAAACWRPLLAEYDAVIGYSTDGILPLICGHPAYLAYEHGTIRNIPFEATAQGRLCALTYRLAAASLITNCDNIISARRLGLDQARFVPHPVNETDVPEHSGRALRARLLRELDATFLVFHPARQHWEPQRHPDWEKGNDVLIRGLAAFLTYDCPGGAAVFVDWGATVDASRALLAELGIADRVRWIAPLPNRRMSEMIAACDVVADQFFLGAFGSLTPKAMRHGTPALLHVDEERHRWCFPELPPVLNARTPDGIRDALRRMQTDPAARAQLAVDARRWYDRYHSAAVIVDVLGRAVTDAVGARPDVRVPRGETAPGLRTVPAEPVA